MPAQLEIRYIQDPGLAFVQINDDHWSKEPRDINKRDLSIGSKAGIFLPPAAYLPVEYRVVGPVFELHDMMAARGNSMIFSKKVRRIIEEMEPLPHHFLPVRLHVQDHVLDDWYHFKFANFLDDAIVFEQSELHHSHHPRTREVDGYSAGHAPKIAWRSDVIAGHHIWADRKLASLVTISDTLLQRFRKENIGRFKVVPGTTVSLQ